MKMFRRFLSPPANFARLLRLSTLPSLALAFVLGAGVAEAQAPAGYYDTVDTTNAATLRATLHEVIDDHLRFPYTSSSTDTWDILEQADEDPLNSQNILDVYRNASYPKAGGGNSNYNREHSWPKSYSFPNDGSTNYPYTDCHHLFLCDSGYNSSRSNKPYRNCNSGCTEKVTDVNYGQGGGSGVYPGNSNWTSGSFASGTWETWGARRGDVARALLYLDVRYEGGVHGGTGAPEPDLILTDNESLIASSNTGSNGSVGYMGMLSVLLQWHAEDPVDSLELWRNDVIYSYQGNRNPFIDNPQWVDCIFSGNCSGGGGVGDVTPPAAPTGLVALAGDALVDLDWDDNGEADLAGYDLYRSTSSGGPYTQVNAALLSVSQYADTGLNNGTAYYYVVTAVDTSSNASSDSLEASATPQGGGGGGTPPADPWINEFHYDNSGSDTGEFVEVAGPAGLDLSGWSLVGYNGNGGGSYKTVQLSGVLPDQGGCIGTLGFTFTSMQNGAPDGMALVDPASVVVEFLSYEGSFTASNGPASGMASVNVGVSETSSTPAGYSLQLAGLGSDPSAFTWQSPQVATSGQPNAGQTFDGGCGGGGTGPPAAPTGLAATAGDSQVQLAWNANTEGNLAGYDVHRSLTSGGPYAQLNAALITTETYTDALAVNGTTYYYVVTAVDTSGGGSDVSNEASATPMDMTPPAAPTALVATASDGSVSLNWADNTEPDLLGYDVYRSTSSGGPYTQLNGLALSTSDYLDGSLTNGTTYYYVVTASDLSGNVSANSFEDSATPLDSTPPAAPSGLSATANVNDIALNWSDNGEADLAGYDVWRSLTSGGGYSKLNGALVSVSAFTDASASTGVTYYYVVTAADTSGNSSPNSNQASATIVDSTPPAAPSGLSATGADGEVQLNWPNNSEGDLAGYTVYRSLNSGSGFAAITGTLLGASDYLDTAVTNGTTYYYVVTASDGTGNESSASAEASATPQAAGGGPAATPWINEFHYDNSGKDKNEFVEVAGPAGTSLSGWKLVAYNGNGGSSYKTVNLSGTIPDQQAGSGTLGFSFSKLQNGAPDGIALVDASGTVVQFLSYEGSFTAGNGPAAGMASTDVGVTEPGSTPKGHSLQLSGTGSSYADFTWQSPQANTKGQVNAGQSFISG